MTYPEWYRRISAPFRSEGAAHAINVLDKVLVAFVAIVYVGIVAFLAITFNLTLWKMLLVPAATFGIVTALRTRIDAPRPYELYDIDPIIVKETRGRSMPSRHVASAVIIACALTWWHPDLGAVGFLSAAVVSFTRIVGGVHFPRDVVAAIVLAAACGLVGFVIIP